MAPRTTSYEVIVDEPQAITLSQGEDRDLELNFQDPENAPFVLTGYQQVRFTVKDNDGLELFARVAEIAADPTTGTVTVSISGSDTRDAAAQTYDCDCYGIDSLGQKVQLLVRSPFRLMRAVGDPGDPATAAPAPVVNKLAVFDGSSNEVELEWTEFGRIPNVRILGVTSDSTEALSVWIVESSVTATGCTVRANVDFEGVVEVQAAAVATSGTPSNAGGILQVATASALPAASLLAGQTAWVKRSKTLYVADEDDLKWIDARTGYRLDRYLQRLLERGVTMLFDPTGGRMNLSDFERSLTRDDLKAQLFTSSPRGESTGLYPAAAHGSLRVLSGSTYAYTPTDLEEVAPVTAQWWVAYRAFSGAATYNTIGWRTLFTRVDNSGLLTVAGDLGSGPSTIITGPTVALNAAHLVSLGLNDDGDAVLMIDGEIVGTAPASSFAFNLFGGDLNVNISNGDFSWQTMMVDRTAPDEATHALDYAASQIAE